MQGAKLAAAEDLEPAFRHSSAPLPDGLHVESWRDLDLAAIEVSWQRLADTASTPNAFFEAFFLRPSLALLDAGGEVQLALLVRYGELRALLPCVESRTYQGRRLPNAMSWLHANIFCGVPLIETGFEEAFWQAYLAASDRNGGRHWFCHFPQLPLDWAATRALKAVCESDGWQFRIVCREERAMLRSGSSPEDHLANAMSRKSRKELRRQRNRLDELGTVEMRRSRTAEGIDQWLADFLNLESGGWKGKHGSALASHTKTEAMFRNVLSSAARAGRLEHLSLTLDGKPIAMLATFLAHPGSFAFKTAFDEEFARFSPGMQLQVENLALLDDPDLAWCDSCAAPNHPMIEHIWRDKREMVWITVEAGRGWRRQLGKLWARIEAWRMERRQ